MTERCLSSRNRLMAQASFDTPEHLREFFFAMIESLPGGILLADRQGNLLAVNQKGCPASRSWRVLPPEQNLLGAALPKVRSDP